MAARRALGLVVLAALPAACAVYKDDLLPSPLEGGVAGSTGGGGIAGAPAGGQSGSGAGGASATSGNGSSGTAGSTSVSEGGEGGTGGEATGGAGGEGADGGSSSGSGGGGRAGAGGMGGTGNGAGAGGHSGGGHGGVSQGGAGQSGGGQGGGGGSGGKVTGPRCSDHPITESSSWVPTASHQGTSKDFISYLTDNKTTRWSTNRAQMGDEWIQVDFGEPVSLTNINLQQAQENANDYPRKYSVIVSNTADDLDGTVRVSGTGVAGVSTAIALPSMATGRYLLIKQTGTSLSWWSAAEIEISCVDLD